MFQQKTKVLGIPDSRIILLLTSLHILFRYIEYIDWDFRVEVDDEIRDAAYNASF